MESRVLESETKEYFGCLVNVMRYESNWRIFPWVFSVKHNGVWHDYVGIPNQCKSKASALKRGWYRAKWLHDGTYTERYK